MNKEPDQFSASHDVTQVQLLRENARLRGDLLTIARRISHDLRTPLGGIITTSEALKEILSEQDSASAPLVLPILDSTDGIAKIIKRVSFILKASAQPLPKEPVQMREVVFNVQQHLESKILKKKVMIAEPASWPEVSGVFSWLEVIWSNLLTNALQHGKDRIELGWQKEKNELRFWVSDDGQGVPPEKCSKLFQPFHTLHEADSAAGLGLSLVQRLVELQGGNCGFESRSPSGSRFFFLVAGRRLKKRLIEIIQKNKASCAAVIFVGLF